jgi:hypothetical protein
VREEALDWTKDRIQTLTKPEVKQLRANAQRLDEPGVVALCDEVLGAKIVKSKTVRIGKAKTVGVNATRESKAAKTGKERKGD